MLVRELEVKYKSCERRPELKHVSGPNDVFTLMLPYVNNKAEESFYALLLNNKNGLHGIIEVSKGTISESLVHPREVFRAAVTANSSSIIIVHNHPSGNLSPSKEDIETTKRLKQAADILGIPLLDHIICTDASYFSFKGGGYI